ncbi:MAG TPA: hypothetical protein VHX42_01345 [Candidatus Babeliales bacterium]|jgi:hypothetical protein|nr:hypothetical protein [Candidatus Babeliales bacterium]
MVHKKFSKNIISAQLALFFIPTLLNGMLNAEKAKKLRRKSTAIQQLLSQKKMQIIPDNLSWKEDYSKCVWAAPKSSISDVKKLELTLVTLHENEDIDVKEGIYNLYRWPAIKGDRPFFNNEGGVSYFIVGNIVSYTNRYKDDDAYLGYFNTVIECKMNNDGEIKSRKCYIGCDESKFGFPLSDLLNLPKLLKAIVQSTKVHDYIDYGIPSTVFMLDGVIIPKDYTEVTEHALSEYGCSSYDTLPTELKKHIDAQFAKQQCENMVEDK